MSESYLLARSAKIFANLIFTTSEIAVDASWKSDLEPNIWLFWLKSDHFWPLFAKKSDYLTLVRLIWPHYLHCKGVRCQIFDSLEICTKFYGLSHQVIRISIFWLLFPKPHFLKGANFGAFCPFLRIEDQESKNLNFQSILWMSNVMKW